VRQGEEVVSEDTFFSRYQPWAAKYLYGPGTTLPPSVPAPEPEPEVEAEPEPEPQPEG